MVEPFPFAIFPCQWNVNLKRMQQYALLGSALPGKGLEQLLRKAVFHVWLAYET